MIDQLSMHEIVPSGKYKPRRRNQLRSEEHEAIIEAYYQEHISQKEIARRHRVTERLVSNLICESKAKPEKLRDLKAREKLATRRVQSIKEVVSDMQSNDRVIYNSQMVREQVRQSHDIKVSAKLTQAVMKKECHLSFIKAKKLQPGTNTEKTMVARQ